MHTSPLNLLRGSCNAWIFDVIWHEHVIYHQGTERKEMTKRTGVQTNEWLSERKIYKQKPGFNSTNVMIDVCVLCVYDVQCTQRVLESKRERNSTRKIRVQCRREKNVNCWIASLSRKFPSNLMTFGAKFDLRYFKLDFSCLYAIFLENRNLEW